MATNPLPFIALAAGAFFLLRKDTSGAGIKDIDDPGKSGNLPAWPPEGHTVLKSGPGFWDHCNAAVEALGPFFGNFAWEKMGDEVRITFRVLREGYAEIDLVEGVQTPSTEFKIHCMKLRTTGTDLY